MVMQKNTAYVKRREDRRDGREQTVDSEKENVSFFTSILL